jgi:hypothetical protein
VNRSWSISPLLESNKTTPRNLVAFNEAEAMKRGLKVRCGDDFRIASWPAIGWSRSAFLRIQTTGIYRLLPMNCSTISRRCGRALCSAI